jgi:hypothetical protein
MRAVRETGQSPARRLAVKNGQDRNSLAKIAKNAKSGI